MERLLDENDHVSHPATAPDRQNDFPNAPHTNALRDYIRTHYNNNEFQHTFPPNSTFDHLEVLQNQNILASPLENSTAHHYLENTKLSNRNNNSSKKDLTSTLMPHQAYLQPRDKTESTDLGNSASQSTVT